MENIETIKVEKSKIEGVVNLSGAKNSALRLLAASILTDESVILENYPAGLLDAQIHVEMLQNLGKVCVLGGGDSIKITSGGSFEKKLVWNKRSIRNTLLIIGALLSRYGYGAVPLPGGCKLGDRKYDIHVMVMESMGAKVWEDGDYLHAEVAGGLTGCDIKLPIRSTGATENAIIMGVLAKGTTRIWNPHIRPEIIDLVDMLNKMGAKITIFGQEHIEIVGVEGLRGVRHQVISDNMEAITWVVAAAITGGDLEIRNFPHQDLEVVLAHLKAAGAQLYKNEFSTIIRGSKCYPLEISTGPHPGINSDVQPVLAAWAAAANGESRIIDLRFPGRYGYAEELNKMGLNTKIDGDMLKIYGAGGNLRGAKVKALDLRAGAALLLSGLMANGLTEIEDAWQISRGYVDIVGKMKSLGAKVYY